MRRSVSVLGAVLMVTLAACSDGGVTITALPSSTTSAAPTTTLDPDASVIFGDGSIPETFPGDFPIPQGAVVGGTMIDRNRDVTEVIFRVRAGLDALVQFFDQNLPARGYEILSSSGDDTTWRYEIANDAFTGTIALSLGTPEVSQAAVRLAAAG